MKKSRLWKNSRVWNVVLILIITLSFVTSMVLVRNFARQDCFDRIEETTSQLAVMFSHAMDERQDKLTVFADILAANSENPPELLQKYMETFCRTQYFSGMCIHRPDGRITAYGEHPHNTAGVSTFEEECAKLPYISKVFSEGDLPEQNRLFQAVPIVRNGETIAVLYGYMTLDVMPSFIATDAYNGKCQTYVVDGDTGRFLMDEYHGYLGTVFEGSLSDRETKPGYDTAVMRKSMENGESGYMIFRSQRTGQWYYTYYMPLGINNWSIQMTIDEPTAFGAYESVSQVVVTLMIFVMALLLVHVFLLMRQSAQVRRKDKERLHKSRYINEVQGALLNAYTNPDFVSRALQIVAEETKAETALLLSFSNKRISVAEYWPQADMPTVMELVGKHAELDFPVLYKMLSGQSNVVYNKDDENMSLPLPTRALFARLEVDNIALVPIMDTEGALKGALAVVNVEGGARDCAMVECVTYDFFMAIANRESHEIIKRMGEMDYLTNTKNRNSFEADMPSYAHIEGRSLWCVFIDVNGLHEVNNTRGHRAGDMMLCSVADAVKRIFGEGHTYRHGGDEFVSFSTDGTHESFMHKKYQLTEELAAKGYFVSVGFAGVQRSEDGLFDVNKVVTEAESIMYKDKWAYYQANNLPSSRGHFPHLMTENE